MQHRVHWNICHLHAFVNKTSGVRSTFVKKRVKARRRDDSRCHAGESFRHQWRKAWVASKTGQTYQSLYVCPVFEARETTCKRVICGPRLCFRDFWITEVDPGSWTPS